MCVLEYVYVYVIVSCQCVPTHREALDGLGRDDLVAVAQVLLVVHVAEVDGALQPQQLVVVLSHVLVHHHRREVDHVHVRV